MNIKTIINNYSIKLKDKSTSPILDIELLLCQILNKSKEYIFTYPEKKLTNRQLSEFKKLFNRRADGEPIAYITGYKDFYNLRFKVNKNVLIPRPESEILVENVIQFTKRHKPLAICDIGTGSGAIIITLAKNLKGKFYGTDISAKALTIAEQNAKTHDVFCHTELSRSINKNSCIKLLKGNLLEPLCSKPKAQSSKLIITANLPYLDNKEKNLLPNRDTQGLKFEPKIALYGGDDGLKYYREFFEQINQYKLKPQAIFLEIGHSQAKQIKKLARQVLPKYKFKVKKDLCGFDRLIIITK
jgi:release factor glutamine methyltransferase